MLAFCGFNFMEDLYALNPVPTNTQNITNIKVENGIFDNLNITRDVVDDYPTKIPTTWDYLTMLNATFNGTLHAGNTEFIGSQISTIRIKRRIKGTFDWITLYEIPTHDVSDLQFIRTDHLNQNGVTYEYSFVPVIGGTEINYITNEIYSEFNGIFICDKDTIFKYYYDVEYGSFNRVNKSTVFEPLGRKYPVVVSNALINYTTGSIGGTIITEDSILSDQIDRVAERVNRDKLLDFLTNKRAKILKDKNGAIYLIMVTGNPIMKPVSKVWGAVANVSFNFTEIGDSQSSKDLYESGLLELTTGGVSNVYKHN